jgi:hypothetical protein
MSHEKGRQPWQGRHFRDRHNSTLNSAHYTRPNFAELHFQGYGAAAAEIGADLIFRRQVETLCAHPRLMAELLAEIAAERSIRTEVEAKLDRFTILPPLAIEATGAGLFWPMHVRLVPR